MYRRYERAVNHAGSLFSQYCHSPQTHTSIVCDSAVNVTPFGSLELFPAKLAISLVKITCHANRTSPIPGGERVSGTSTTV